MIETLRKYNGLIIIMFAVLGVSFLFMDTSSMRSIGSGQSILKISGRTYDDKEFKNLGESSLELAKGLGGSGDIELYYGFIAGLCARKFDDPEQFFIGRMILREAKSDFGVFPGEEEISSHLRSLRAFAGADNKFDAEKYQNFITKYLGRLGMTEKDLRELASDVIASKKISAIVGSGLTMDRSAVANNLALENQQITGDVARLSITPFEEKIEPTEEEIKTYWGNLSDSFTTEPRRKFTYVIVTPDMPEEAKAEPEAPETIADAAASEEVKKEAEKKKEEAKAKRAADLATARRAKQLETDTLVDDFLFALEQQKGTGFEELAKTNKWQIITSELFTRSTAPKDLDVNIRSSSNGGKAIDSLFKINETKDPFSKISEAIPIGENQWIVARLDGEEKSRPKTYEEARADARAQLISEKAAEALKTAANEAVTKIKTLLVAGKSFADAAKEAGVPDSKAFSAIISTYRPDEATEPKNLFEAAKTIDPGSIAEVIIESDRAFILHVAKREVVKSPDAATRLDSELTAAASENERIAFSSWMTARTEAAKVEQLYKR
jgi:hypothetical protein